MKTFEYVSLKAQKERKEYCTAIATGDIAKVRKLSKRRLLLSEKWNKVPTLGFFAIAMLDNCWCWGLTVEFIASKDLLKMAIARKCECVSDGKNAARTRIVTPLHIACYYGKHEVARYLLRKDPTALNHNDFVSPLMMASLCRKEVNALRIATMLVEAGADIDDTSEAMFHYTALHLAAFMNRSQIVTQLLSKGCIVNSSKCLLTPLFLAAGNECAEILLAYGANVLNSEMDFCPLLQAISVVDVETVRRYVSSPTFRPGHRYESFDDKRYSGMTILHGMLKASLHRICFVEIINILHSTGVDIDSIMRIVSDDDFVLDYKDVDGFDASNDMPENGPASFLACQHSQAEVLEQLLSLGSDVNITNDYGMTALMYAAAYASKESSRIISILLKYGANVNARDKWGRPALYYFLVGPFEYREIEPVELLLNAGAEMDVRCISQHAPDGESLLWHMIHGFHYKQGLLFLLYGFDLKKEDWLREKNCLGDSQPRMREILRYLMEEIRTKDDLKCICRRNLRCLLRGALFDSVGELGLPIYLQEYLSQIL